VATMDPGHPGYVLYRLADLKLTQGHVPEAHQLAEQSLSELRQKQDGLQYLTGGMLVMGDALEASDDLDGARKQFEEALDIRQKMGATDLVAETRVELAQLSIEQGHPADAEPLLQNAIPTFEKDASDPEASSASLLLSRALAMEGKAEAAREALKRATLFAHNTPDPALQLPISIQTAKLNGSYPVKADAAREVSVAEQQLRSAAARARELGYYSLECKARLALGEFEMRVHPASGRALLATLASEAHGRGLELLARHAQEARSSGGKMMAEGQSAR
jgi:tetratricopeptide (TPR) repeat protein